jgi:acyl carrier protein
MAELKEEVRDLIAEIIEKDPSDVGDDVPLKNLNVDSMQAVEIIAAIERKYAVKIADDEFRKVTTVASVCGLLEQKLAAKRG